MSQFLCRTVVGCFLLCACVIAPARADASSADSTFTVSSFLPTLFRDFQWRIEGNTNFDAQDRDDDRSYDYDQSQADRRSDDLTHTGRVNLENSALWRWESYDRQFQLSGTLLAEYSDANRSSDFSEWRDLGEYQIRNWSSERLGVYRLDGRLTASVLEYLWEDLFVGGAGSASYSYGEDRRTVNNESRRHYLFESTPGDTLERHDDRHNSTENFAVHHDNRLTGEASVGWGRFYHGEYAATAMYIVDELRRSGLLLREPTFDELLALTKIVYERRLELTPDNRWQTLDAIADLCQLLSSAGVLADTEQPAASIVMDVWEYFPQKSRLFGWSAEVTVGGMRRGQSSGNSSSYVDRRISVEHDPASQTTDTIIDVTNRSSISSYNKAEPAKTGYIEVSGSWHRPLSARHQLDLSASVIHEFDETTENYYPGEPEFVYREDRDRLEMRCDAGLNYFYDARTTFQAVLTASYFSGVVDFRQRIDSGEVYSDTLLEHNRSYSTRVAASVGGTYRISVPTDIRASISLSRIISKYHEPWEERKDSRWAFGLSAAISHYIF